MVTAIVGGFAVATSVIFGGSISLAPGTSTNTTETSTQGNSGHPPNLNASPNNKGTANTTTTTTILTTTVLEGPKGQIKNNRDSNVTSSSSSSTSVSSSSSGPGNSQH
jgi:hypothetical protein